jgi:hypothetical protein
MTEQLYTSSRLKTLRQCLRLHLYKYIFGIRGPETDVMRFGTVGHKALEAYLLAWKAGELEQRLPRALAEVETLPGIFEQAKLRALLVAYDLRWGGEDWEILAVEVEFRYELGGYLIGGKVDAIIRDRRDGRVYVLEHKTTGSDASPGSTYWERLTIDTQVSVYVDGATTLGYEIAGVIYDVLARPRHEAKLATPIDKRSYTKPVETKGKGCTKCGGRAGGKGGPKQGSGMRALTAEERAVAAGVVDAMQCEACSGTGWSEPPRSEPARLHANQRAEDETGEAFADRVAEAIAADLDGFLLRGTVVRLEDELPKMRADLLDAIKLERICAAVELAPRNPDACARFGSLCSFFDACSGRADINDPLRFPRGELHPELGAPQP